MLKLSAMTIIAVLVASPSALAYTQQDASACTPDAFRLCQDAIPDAGRVATCLFQNKQRLSPACGAVFSRSRDARSTREHPVAAETTGFGTRD